MKIPVQMVDFFLVYGVIAFSITILLLILAVYNYFKYKNIYYSVRDVENDYLKIKNTEYLERITTLQNENEEISKIIIGKLK